MSYLKPSKKTIQISKYIRIENMSPETDYSICGNYTRTKVVVKPGGGRFI